MNSARQLLSIEDRIWSQLQRLRALMATDSTLAPVESELAMAWSTLRQEALNRSRQIEAAKAASASRKQSEVAP